MINVFIDATNIGAGGGITHLTELITHFDSRLYGMRLTICASRKVLNKIPKVFNVEKVTHGLLNRSLISRILFQVFYLDRLIVSSNSDILFSLTGDYFGSFRFVVGMSRNMILYNEEVLASISSFKEKMRFRINYLKQRTCFRRAAGILFISEYARETVLTKLGLKNKNVKVVYHGVSNRFLLGLNKNIPTWGFSKSSDSINLLYISTVHIYKYQWNVIYAVNRIRKELGVDLTITLVGDIIYAPAGKLLYKAIQDVKGNGDFVNFLGHVSYEVIHDMYLNASGVIFASSCENMPNTLIEGMASGLPVICSNRSPMPEFLKRGGFYFDPESIESIVFAIKDFLSNGDKRISTVSMNLEEVKKYSWNDTAKETFGYLKKIYENER
jgi:glycosyltransferase involved in cell wall biosynthesis